MYGISLLIFVVLAPLTAGGTQFRPESFLHSAGGKVGVGLSPLEWDTRIYLDVPLEVTINGLFHLLIGIRYIGVIIH